MADMMTISNRCDTVLCFVPQWSPFQPPLSVPSLVAWLRRAGYCVDVFDANMFFYDFLLSEKCRDYLVAQKFDENGNADQLALRKSAIAGINSWRDFKSDISALLRWNDVDELEFQSSKQSVLRDTYKSVNSLDTYLRFVSALSNFTVSPYEFSIKPYSLESSDIERFVDHPPPLLEEFSLTVAKRLLQNEPRIIGLSCIGQEQLIFSLLIGRSIKQLSKIPVVVGGTVFSRIAERNALPESWFDKYIDIIVRNEGEKPLEKLIELKEFSRQTLLNVPGIVFCDKDNGITSTANAAPLSPSEVPVPDFRDMPLGSYITSRITLPLLSSRGCYWGKCEFCHHGMVYGEKYTSYKAYDVVNAIQELQETYKVDYFAFNDEAIPPNMLRKLGSELPDGERKRFFTGLIKFEKFFEERDFLAAYRIGFRSLYVGLESASERVLALMKKNTAKAVMEGNLRDATRAGIWMHCFAFFGFPGETDGEANETINFINGFSENIGSFGAGIFSLEHNAPIMNKLSEYGLTLKPNASSNIDVYYEYKVNNGLSSEKAESYVSELNRTAYQKDEYASTNWIPREQLLVLLSLFGRNDLTKACIILSHEKDVFPDLAFKQHLSFIDDGQKGVLINRLNRVVLDITGSSRDIIRYAYNDDMDVGVVLAAMPTLAEALSTVNIDRLRMNETFKVV